MIDEKAFYPNFLESLTALELAVLQHDLRRFPEDKPYLDQVLTELRRREAFFRKHPQPPVNPQKLYD